MDLLFFPNRPVNLTLMLAALLCVSLAVRAHPAAWHCPAPRLFDFITASVTMSSLIPRCGQCG
jgi:hypothetical protein